jgi:1-acyl-sn-glycerol-3-phosphate acyltransferase
MEKRKKAWTLPRHKVITALARLVLDPVCRLRYGISVPKFREQGDRPYLILYNHQTAFDQFFVGMAFRGPVYYMATEDIFSLGWISKLLRWAVAPIPIRKQTTDITAVMNCIKVAREGGSICIAPEGNRTYSGRTEYMSDSIASLAKKLKLPIALFRIEGGYGVHPRWSDCVRRGRMRGYVSRVIEPEVYADMPPRELFALIEKELYVDEAVAEGPFRHKNRAEYMERAVYVCPFCGLAEWESRGHRATCKKCGRTVSYGLDKRLTGEGFDFPFPFMGQWYDYQKQFVNSLDLTAMTQEPLFLDHARVSEVVVYQKKNLLRDNAALTLYGDRVVLDQGTEQELVLPFAEIQAAACLGKNKLNIYHGKMIYQFKGSKRFNALKYVNLIFRYKNITRGDEHDQFLGL